MTKIVHKSIAYVLETFGGRSLNSDLYKSSIVRLNSKQKQQN